MKWSLIASVIGTLLAGCDVGHPRSDQTRNDFALLTSMLDIYRLNSGRYPTTEQGLAALVNRPTTDPQPEIWTRIVDRVPLDPWGRDYRYRCESDPQTKIETIVIWSVGRDGKDGSGDDIRHQVEYPRSVASKLKAKENF
jgi:general secretion pathway protein G